METKKNYGEKIVALLKQHFMDIEFCATDGSYYAVDLGYDVCRDLIKPDDYGMNTYEGMHLCFWKTEGEGKNNYGGGIHVTLRIYPNGDNFSFCDETEEMQSEIYRLFCKECGVEPDEAEEEEEEPQQPSTLIGYTWDAKCEDGGFEDHGEVFKTQEEAYYDMRDAVLEKMKWNTEWDDVYYECDGDDTLGYRVHFNPNHIVHESYSGKYTYTIKEVHEISIPTLRGMDKSQFEDLAFKQNFKCTKFEYEGGIPITTISANVGESDKLHGFISNVCKSPSERLQEQIDNGTPIVFFFDCDRVCIDDDVESTMIYDMTLEQCLKCAIDYCTLPEYEDAFRWISEYESPMNPQDLEIEDADEIHDEHGNIITKSKSEEELQKFYSIRKMILHRQYIRIIFK